MECSKLPFLAEYSKSSRARCRACNQTIAKDELRLAVIVQALNFDGKIPEWYHEKCFFNSSESPANEEHAHPCPVSEWEIGRFQQLRYEDQLRLRSAIASHGSVVQGTSNVSKTNRNNPRKIDPSEVLDVTYATGVIVCSTCNRTVPEDNMYVQKCVQSTSRPTSFESYHVQCFADLRTNRNLMKNLECLPSWSSLLEFDQARLKKLFPALEDDVVLAKKLKVESKPRTNMGQSKQECKISAQLQTFYNLRDQLISANLDKTELSMILQYNRQAAPNNPKSGTDSILDRVCDIMTFGALERCKKCRGQFVFQGSGYVCEGNVTLWAKCLHEQRAPPRRPTKIPPVLLQKYPPFRAYRCVVQNRIIRRRTKGSVKVNHTLTHDARCIPLANMEFVILGNSPTPPERLAQIIQTMGGKVVEEITKHTAAIVSTKAEVARMGSHMVKAKALQIQVVADKTIEAIRRECGNALSIIASQAICDWGLDPHERVPTKDEGKLVKLLPAKMKIQMKSGLIVDPDSGLAEQAHVYKNMGIIYSCVLNIVHIQQDLNSFYKMQVLEADCKNKYWLFRGWGRIGTTIGGTKIQDFKDANSAVANFHKLFRQKTCNQWQRHDTQYMKYPGKFFPIEIDYNPSNGKPLMEAIEISSTLHPAVQDLIRTLFDIDQMNRVMLELELDLEKLPLGKLSERQLQSAMAILTEIAFLIGKGAPPAQFIDASNRFYTYLPHNFGIKPANVIDTLVQVQEKREMLDNLKQIEFAYSLLSNAASGVSGKSMLDVHYEQLQTDLVPLERDTEEFALLQRYVRNTHASTHSDYELEIEQIFRCARNGEIRRYQPFRDLHNRKLLWHGSRLTNFVGILTNGLKIAPPEAPSTGYMFGKGVYFADMVSKAANYCYSNAGGNSTGLMLLCEVALGDMQEYSAAYCVERLPAGKHSVKGVGRTQPDPSASHFREDGVEIPLGKGITDHTAACALLYNEFIVYDVAQVKCQYLLKVKFHYKVK